MNEQENVQSIREQVFGQPSTHTPTPTNDVPPADQPPVDTPPTDLPPTDTPPSDVVDYNTYVKENFGFDSVEEAKTKIEELRQFQATAPKPIEFANEESRKVFELIQAGKTKEVKTIYDLQEKLETVDTLTPENAIKLHIEQTNKHYKAADVQDVYEEKYTFPDKPILEDGEEDQYKDNLGKWQSAVDKINRRIERDAVTAREELLKLKSEIKLPELPTPINEETEAFNNFKANAAKSSETHKALVDSISVLSEKDINIELNFNDEASKMQFNVSYKGNKEGTDKAKDAAANYAKFLGENYYKEDGSPLADKFTSDIYFLQNKEAILTEAVKQAVNETKAWFLRNQKNISDGTRRNFNVIVPDEVARLREQVFSKTN